MTRKLWIRVDASQDVGIGHLMRCLALAQAWRRRGGEACFLGRCEAKVSKRIAEEGFTICPPEGACRQGRVEEPWHSWWKSTRDHSEWVVLDGYGFGTEYQSEVKGLGKRVLVIDDYNHLARYEADILLNQNIGASHYRYQTTPGCTLLTGTRYALLRNEFLQSRITHPETPEVARRILVLCGGADPTGVTFKILEGLSALKSKDLESRIVVGPANPHALEVKKAASGTGLNIEVVESTDHMDLHMAWADLAITAGGSTCLELAFMGVPFLVLSLAENQREVMSGFDREGIALGLGSDTDLETGILASKLERLRHDRSRRAAFSRKGQEAVDGLGVQRVLEAMDPTLLTIRRAREGDCETVWTWANDPYARAVSFSSERIPLEQHRGWFSSRIHEEGTAFYMASNQWGIPLGQARVESRNGAGVISVNLDPCFKGIGLGSRLIRMASEEAMKEEGFPWIDALIKTQNVTSIHAFEKAGYKQTGDQTHMGVDIVRMRFGERDTH